MENLEWGLKMTVLGMGLVFALLILLWGLLMLVLVLDKEPKIPLSAQDTHAEAERIAALADAAVGAQVPEPATVNGMPADLVAAILVATMKHKLTLRRQAAPFMRSYWPGSELFASHWVATGRARQNYSWQPRGK
ncbi:OadG family transporter subunit [Propionivibrio sp.]|uniref:OadG family transporter subunit n=1 Tax=Propionivibrio sp. TaxID=2212460 RepID=UPI0026087A0D|nr:OadG family transporter subunit [Propionivibrio sp.]